MFNKSMNLEIIGIVYDTFTYLSEMYCSHRFLMNCFKFRHSRIDTLFFNDLSCAV